MTSRHAAASTPRIDDGVVPAMLDAVAGTFDWLRARDVLHPADGGLASVALGDDGAGSATVVIAVDLGDDAFAVFDADGRVLRGEPSPSLSRRHATHRALLDTCGDARVVLDTAPRGLAAWAIAGEPLPIRLAVLAAAVRVREVPLVASAGEAAGAVRDPAARPPGLLLAGHGALTWGVDLRAAARRLLGLEEAARLALLAERLGGAGDFVPGSLARAWGSAPVPAT